MIMKHLLLFVLLVSFCQRSHAQLVLIDENFDAYTDGAPVAQTVGLPWSTWNNQQGGIYDTQLSSEQASSGTLSMLLSSTVAAGGPADIMLRLGDRTTGAYILSWNMYIPQGFGGYFNVQHFEVIGAGSWAMDCTFLPNGLVETSANTLQTTAFYPHDAWFEVKLSFDLGAQQAMMFLNGQYVTGWPTNLNSAGAAGINQLGGINFYAYAGGAGQTRYYVDDVLFLEDLSVDVRAMLPDNGSTVYPNPVSDVLNVIMSDAAADLILFDATGRIVIREGSNAAANSQIAMDVSRLPAGPYFLHVEGASGRTVHRIVKH
jgi:hypothetical protein